MNNTNIKPSVPVQIGTGLTAAALLYPFGIAFAAVSGLSLWYALFTSTVAAILSVTQKNRLFLPEFFTVVPVLQLLFTGDNTLLPIAVVLGTILFLIADKLLKPGIKIPDYVRAAVLLGLSFCVTALLTTHYFGIGAVGGTVWDMLKSYRSLGFHPNWRGVFYGTVALFVMITFPFKCRKINKHFPASFFSLILCLGLDFLLNTTDAESVIREVGTLSKIYSGFSLNIALPFLNLSAQLPVSDYLTALKCAVCIALMLLFVRRRHNDRTAAMGVSNILSGIGGGFPLGSVSLTGYTAASAVTAVAVLSAVFFLLPSVAARIPVHSLAVIIIVAAWQRVPFGALGKAFKSGIYPIFTVLAIFSAFLFAEPYVALVISAALAFIGKEAKRA